MGLLVFVRNLLLALCLFLVLGFLYYSAWKLHLLQWEDSTQQRHTFWTKQLEGVAFCPEDGEYDRLGFLLKLDSKLPAELATKYANFSEGACKPGYASAMMTAIFPRFSKPAPMFLDDSFRKWARIREFVPPFGIKGQDNLIKAILSVTKEYRLTPALDSLHCRRCIIVGNGGVLANKSLGSRIDDYDIVIRLNSAPVKGFERDVGSKTTLRITYPEGAMQRPEQYERDSLFVLAGFKWQDFKWLKYIVYKERVPFPSKAKCRQCQVGSEQERRQKSGPDAQSASDGFWKSVATRVPKEPPEIRILNPYFIQEAAFTLIGLPFNNGLMGRGNIPTLGSVAVTMALHGCDEVAVAGFGYDMNTPNAPLHYYETVRMAAIKESWTHNIQREKEFLRKLVKARVITDLSSGI
ncbi:CMP-N-acetylneuraminate-beta-1,4-galactoside alpha-2,3-sialyltransferase isoform X2 [Mus musculus]|uniref:CMP-N-acetylneuraminate-beta-1,4-galactoside alpha-2,3-sialyltransferase isoform X2 n=1 Tax=Mus musculus TaxID=10090 RepID=UPI0003D79253|nr:CMP-N-acetylneuraminate-beta-1,4-galactoside alpha-2,3-sialyltransferase isoform X2 [Mus musculus]|eukprot:XP_006502956.1 PREDICTED: CMP-N-acetylneuraminate-beta-1,4-galactoside alpha-2,3-sialyltransferase isoform X2 [Mus musculus]